MAKSPTQNGQKGQSKRSDTKISPARLTVRTATAQDVDNIAALSRKVYGRDWAILPEMVRGQINNYAEGQFVAEYDGKIVGHCATFLIGGDVALKPHTWREITGSGYAARHDPNGDYLYGMEVIVDPDYRRLRIGQRLYNARKELCQYLELEGIVFGGRIPGLARYLKKGGDPQEYVRLVIEKKIRDTVLSFHLSNGFDVIGLLPDYLASDQESAGYASHMRWRNPMVQGVDKVKVSHQRGRLPDSVRIATVQFQMRRIAAYEEFEQQVEFFVDVAADYKADFVTFPELFTLELLSLEKKKLSPAASIERVSEYTGRFRKSMTNMAVGYNINIIAGSHPTRMEDGTIRNIAHVFLRDGSVYAQDKIHPTPNERYWWNITGGDRVEAITTDCGPIGVLICYDAEFPELARHLADQGALILFVPFCTDERRGYLRVRYCAQARAVENQYYVVLSGVVGNLPNVENMDIHYAESAILTPCDFPFARDGVAADTAPNTETIAFADLRLQDLILSRNSGTVQNLKDRRFDLYNVNWKGGGKA